MTAGEAAVLTRRGILHRYPAWESCNLDDAAEHVVFLEGPADGRRDPAYRRDCRRCYPGGGSDA